MALSTIRRFTDDDAAALNTAAARFAARHSILLDSSTHHDFWRALDAELNWQARDGEPKLFRLWQRVVCRALRVPQDVRTTVAYGHVGVTVT